jgi:hypothetical protein
MTSHSLVPKAARALGIDFETACWRVLETSFARDSEFGDGASEGAGAGSSASGKPGGAS